MGLVAVDASTGGVENSLVGHRFSRLQFGDWTDSTSTAETVMKKFMNFVFGVAVGAAVMFVALKFHVVRAEDGFHMVPKTLAKLNSIYVDIREFTIADWDGHRELALDLANSRKAYLLEDAAKNTLNNAVLDIFDGLDGTLGR